MKVACTIQMRRFDTLIDSLDKNHGDAVIASLVGKRRDARARRFQRSLLPHAGALRGAPRPRSRRPSRRRALEGKKVAVVAGTAHEAYLKALFTEAELHPYPNAEAARAALTKGEVDLLFGDGISLAFWLNGTDFCRLLRIPRRAVSRKPLFRRRRRHRGAQRGNDLLRQAFNWALFRLWEKGRFTDLWLRYFPISPF